MTGCKGCPFMYWDGDYGFLCNLDYEIKTPSPAAGCRTKDTKATSEDCKLFAVTYAIKNERESIHFVPKQWQRKVT